MIDHSSGFANALCKSFFCCSFNRSQSLIDVRKVSIFLWSVLLSQFSYSEVTGAIELSGSQKASVWLPPQVSGQLQCSLGIPKVVPQALDFEDLGSYRD